jgi:hypothetical protein
MAARGRSACSSRRFAPGYVRLMIWSAVGAPSLSCDSINSRQSNPSLEFNQIKFLIVERMCFISTTCGCGWVIQATMRAVTL